MNECVNETEQFSCNGPNRINHQPKHQPKYIEKNVVVISCAIWKAPTLNSF